MATSEERSRRWGGALLGTMLASAPGCAGGQSGTEDSQACSDPKPIPADQNAGPYIGFSPNEFLAKVAGPTILDGLWFTTNSRSTLSIEVSRTPSATAVSDCYVLIDTTVTVRSDDGAIDTTSPVEIRTDGGEATFPVPLPALPSEDVGPPLWAPDRERVMKSLKNIGLSNRDLENLVLLDAPSPSLAVAFAIPNNPLFSRAVVVQGHDVRGAWSTMELGGLVTGPPTPYAVPRELANSCSGAEQFQTGPVPPIDYTHFSSSDDARAGEVGTWVRCLDNTTASDRAGIQILPDGSWRDIVLDGGTLLARHGFERDVVLDGGTLLARHGFEREGNITLIDTSSWNHKPGLYQIGFSGQRAGFGGIASSRALVFKSATPDWPKAVYLPTTLPVREEAPQYAEGERAGAAACGSAEQGVIPTPDETLATFTGSFVLCTGTLSGGVTELRFADGRVDLLGAGGSLVESWRYQADRVNNSSPVGVILHPSGGLQEDFKQWFVMASRFPRKLWIQEAWDFPPAVFSAMP